MIVVSDTTAITTLLKAGEARLLQTLFGEVTVPQAVWDELMEFHSGLPDFVSLRPVADARQRPPETASLGRVEAEAIQLARELNADLLLMDDRKAARAAAELGIRCAGLLGLVVRARQAGQIPSARDFVEQLETRGGLYLSETVKAEILRLAGESASIADGESGQRMVAAIESASALDGNFARYRKTNGRPVASPALAH